nr:immunoglobulin heavy chain junction region [Macaca mulatta]MOX67870.1 immunoglobulin heavy chain junction region [Macaca mulatta]
CAAGRGGYLLLTEYFQFW